MDDNNKETIQNFCDMVTATHKLVKPWVIFCGILAAIIVLTNAIWGFVLWKQLQYAYMTPEQYTQEQMFEEQSQSQSYSSGAADGE